MRAPVNAGALRNIRSAYATSCDALSSHGAIHAARASSRASASFPLSGGGRSGVTRRRSSATLARFRHQPVRLDLFGHLGFELLFEQVTEPSKQSHHCWSNSPLGCIARGQEIRRNPQTKENLLIS